jgi:hypothetical protein
LSSSDIRSTSIPARSIAATARGLNAVASVPAEKTSTGPTPYRADATPAQIIARWLRRELWVHTNTRRAGFPSSSVARMCDARASSSRTRSALISPNSPTRASVYAASVSEIGSELLVRSVMRWLMPKAPGMDSPRAAATIRRR